MSTVTYYTTPMQYRLQDSAFNEDVCANREAQGMHIDIVRYFAYILTRASLYAS